MKIQLASDLHLEFLQRDLPGLRLINPVPDADVLVLAGDIGNGTQAMELFADWPVPVIYIAGNHEFYDHPIDGMREKMRKCTPPNMHFLENGSIVIKGVRFLGATLWTDYRVVPGCLQSKSMKECGFSLNDHSLIRTGRHTFTPSDALALHEESRAWLEQELAKPFDGKTVVVTHHGCHPLSIHPRYSGQPLNGAFVSDLTDVMPGADLWLHGHVHDGFDYRVGNCRVVANPAGYIRNLSAFRPRSMSSAHPFKPVPFQFENARFKPNLVIEI